MSIGTYTLLKGIGRQLGEEDEPPERYGLPFHRRMTILLEENKPSAKISRGGPEPPVMIRTMDTAMLVNEKGRPNIESRENEVLYAHMLNILSVYYSLT